MLSFEEATWDLREAVDEFLKQLNYGPVKPTTPMPDEMPPVAQRLWNHCQGILRELESDEFQEIA